MYSRDAYASLGLARVVGEFPWGGHFANIGYTSDLVLRIVVLGFSKAFYL